MKKILTIIGARPQFIKAAPLSKAIGEIKNFEEIILHTGQHFDEKMSDIFFNEMKIPLPKYRFNINNLNHGAMTGLMLKEIETVLLTEKPDLVIVFGDTNSTLAGALAAKKLHLKVAHVEAGLRSFNNEMPEEINRILTDRISDYAFCPSEQSVQNLKNEGYDNFNTEVVRTGDIMLDAMMMFADIAEEHSKIIDTVGREPYVLATIHRAENTNDLSRLSSIISALESINNKIKIILPLHPRTQKIMVQAGIRTNLTIIEPVGYFDMLTLIKNCAWVMTDSGGLQKEAYFMKKFCITLRDQTEWVELTRCGANILVGADTDLIIQQSLKIAETVFDLPAGLYGNGQVSKQIVSYLEKCI
jgi:UDP-GlcNAc3NAcA epimerase